MKTFQQNAKIYKERMKEKEAKQNRAMDSNATTTTDGAHSPDELDSGASSTVATSSQPEGIATTTATSVQSSSEPMSPISGGMLPLAVASIFGVKTRRVKRMVVKSLFILSLPAIYRRIAGYWVCDRPSYT